MVNPWLRGPKKSRTNLEIFKWARWEGLSFKDALKFAFSGSSQMFSIPKSRTLGRKGTLYKKGKD